MLAADVHVDFQGSFSVDAYADAGWPLLIIKATEGITFRARMQQWRARANARGLTLGLYHFARANDPHSEADNFLDHTGGLRANEFAVYDWEEDASPGQARAWLDDVEGATGRLPILYSGPGFMAPQNTSGLTRWPLWVASYGRDNGEQPAAWPDTDRWEPFENGPGDYPHAGRTIGWQFTSKGSFPGYGGVGDLNRFDMSLEAVRRLGGSSGPAVDSDPYGHDGRPVVVFA